MFSCSQEKRQRKLLMASELKKVLVASAEKAPNEPADKGDYKTTVKTDGKSSDSVNATPHESGFSLARTGAPRKIIAHATSFRIDDKFGLSFGCGIVGCVSCIAPAKPYIRNGTRLGARHGRRPSHLGALESGPAPGAFCECPRLRTPSW